MYLVSLFVNVRKEGITGTAETRWLPRIGGTLGSGVKLTPEFDPLEDIICVCVSMSL